MTLGKFLLFAGFLLSLSSCGPILMSPSAASATAPARILEDGADYRLNVGDILKITVYGDDTLTGTYAIDQNGMIMMPLAGHITAAGLTATGLQTKISRNLVAGHYLTKPLVTVDVTTVSPFYILGEVHNPGSYPYQPSLDVFKAVATAGGYTPRAAKNKVLIDRGFGAERHEFNATEGTPILPGDSITVRERIF